MATLTRISDDTFSVTLTLGERRVVARWAQDNQQTPLQLLKSILEGQIIAKRTEYARTEGGLRQLQYEALQPAQQQQVDALQAQVDAILATARVSAG